MEDGSGALAWIPDQRDSCSQPQARLGALLLQQRPQDIGVAGAEAVDGPEEELHRACTVEQRRTCWGCVEMGKVLLMEDKGLNVTLLAVG